MKASLVKNRAPAEIQITAEQLLREARERQVEEESTVRQRADEQLQQIHDPEELALYQTTKRKEFEDRLRHTLHSVSNYLNYAKWEAGQLEFRRARSIYERALEVDYRDYQVWLRYAEFEMKNRFVNHARNVWNRAVTLLPRVSQLWYKFVHMEEILGEVDNARAIFERWLKWEPEQQAWFSYINFEERCGDLVKARQLYERLCVVYPESKSFIKYASWEERHRQLALSRQVFERAFEELPESEKKTEHLFLAFAKFEERCKEFERTRFIYKQALEILPKSESKKLYEHFVQFEKKYGTQEAIDGVVLSKKRLQYEKELLLDSKNYDVWFDFIRLEESQAIEQARKILLSHKTMATTPDERLGTVVDKMQENGSSEKEALVKAIQVGRERVRDVYERAIAEVPPIENKVYWKRYVYLWIYYATFEELVVREVGRARNIYNMLLEKVIPHHVFTFGKVWIYAAELEIRQKQIDDARKILGFSIGRCPKRNVFNFYIKLEKQLGNTDRCRKLMEKYIEFMPTNSELWLKYANLERQVMEYDRFRAIMELALKQENLDLPEIVWRKYIEFEISQKKFAAAEELYKRLLNETKHYKIYISYAKFLGLTFKRAESARNILKQGEEFTIERGLKGERKILLDSWVDLEKEMIQNRVPESGEAHVLVVEKRLPKRLKKRREIFIEGNSVWEEYYDFVFPEEESSTKGLKLLEIAQKWKQKGGAFADLQSGVEKNPSSSGPLDVNEIELDA